MGVFDRSARIAIDTVGKRFVSPLSTRSPVRKTHSPSRLRSGRRSQSRDRPYRLDQFDRLILGPVSRRVHRQPKVVPMLARSLAEEPAWYTRNSPTSGSNAPSRRSNRAAPAPPLENASVSRNQRRRSRRGARRRSTAVAFGAVADHAIGTEPGKVDADRDQAFSCVQRAQCFAVEQCIAAAEADLRQTRPLAHHNWKRARADLGVKRAMIPRGNMIEAARLGYHAGENIESAGRTFGIGGGGGVGGKRQTFDLALRCRASRRLVLRTKSFPSRCTPPRQCPVCIC